MCYLCFQAITWPLIDKTLIKKIDLQERAQRIKEEIAKIERAMKWGQEHGKPECQMSRQRLEKFKEEQYEISKLM